MTPRRCPRCDGKRFSNGTARRQAVYTSLEEHVSHLFRSRYLAQALRRGEDLRPPVQPAAGNRELVDFTDSSIHAELYREEETDEVVLYIVMCFDGVEVEKNVTYTPVTAKLLNLPPGLRGQLGNLWLLGFFPPHVQDYDTMLTPIVEQLATHRPGANHPIEVWDAHTQRYLFWYVYVL